MNISWYVLNLGVEICRFEVLEVMKRRESVECSNLELVAH